MHNSCVALLVTDFCPLRKISTEIFSNTDWGQFWDIHEGDPGGVTRAAKTQALRRLVQRMAELSGPLEVTLPTAVMEALPSMIELRLRLTVRFRAERWVAQPLGSPTYVGTTQAGLHQAVSSWRP
ncbi:hypothetical protein AK812_SmicGene27355 [Symbiodinium microadriaticum]|uniref:Uncharacterized protein n=1 Tax=Symbiodinium microadriaticum TaxID=2951 RepID=A0A1Q9D724_SYMMI|nr:hypothetical protein AK812_SmicGene27355 [Symbiodinium microadriaticum]